MSRAVRDGRSGRRWPVVLASGLLLLAAGGAFVWATSAVLTPANEVLETSPFTYASVQPGEVGSSIELNATAEWAPEPIGVNRATGVVTNVALAAGDEVSQGSTIFSVDLRPVVVAVGDVPAFRTIGEGTSGADVAQLQRMLADRGFYSGPADGQAEAGTVRAIRAWQKDMEVAVTGSVEAGDVIFVPRLPTRVVLNSTVIFRGATLNGGEPVLSGLPVAPTFEVPVTDAQAALMPAGTRVDITSPEAAEWVGYASEQSTDPETGTVLVRLQGEGGNVICAEQCAQVPVTGETRLQARIVTVETVSGLVVPSAALVTDAAGQVAVIDEAGTRLPVTVTAAARGMSVVEGVDTGTRVRVPATGQ